MSFGRMLPRAFGQILHPNQLASHTAGPHGGATAQARLGGGGDSHRYLDEFEERRQDEDWRRLASDETPRRLSGGAPALLGPRGTSPAVVAYREEKCVAYTERTGLRAPGLCAGAGVPEAAETPLDRDGGLDRTRAGARQPTTTGTCAPRVGSCARPGRRRPRRRSWRW
jgi:hypothetical protein